MSVIKFSFVSLALTKPFTIWLFSLAHTVVLCLTYSYNNITILVVLSCFKQQRNEKMKILTKTLFVFLAIWMSEQEEDTKIGTSNTTMVTEQDVDVFFKMVYHEIKPYMYEENGRPAGVFVDVFRVMTRTFCSHFHPDFVKLEKKASNMRTFFDLFRNKSVQYEDGEFQNISKGNVVWGPIVTAEQFDANWLKSRNVEQAPVLMVENMVVIVQESKVGIVYKLFFALLTCLEILFATIFFCFISGVIFWLLERGKNTLLYHPSFAQSIINGVWWSFVTMTTVGYGDFVPRTVFGRLWSVCWMYVALFSTCIMTATVTNVVYGVEDLSIEGQRVGVMTNSYEGLSAVQTYSTENVEFNSVNQLLKAIREGEVYAGLINEDIAAWYYQELSIEHLVVIARLPVNIQISALFSTDVIKEHEEMWKCFRDNYEPNIILKYHKKVPIEVVTVDDVPGLLQNILVFQVLFGVVGVFIVGGVTFDIINGSLLSSLRRKKHKKEQSGAKSRIRNELQQLNMEFENELKVLRFGH